MTVFAQFTSSHDSSVIILYNPCLIIPCMILVSVVHHLSFHFYWLQDLIYSDCKRKALYSSRYAAFLVKNNIQLCGKFYGLSPSPEQARPYVEASERKLRDVGFFGTSSKSKEEIKKFQRE